MAERAGRCGVLPKGCRQEGGTGTIKETLMNWNQIEGNWEQFKGKIQQQWGKLTDDDLQMIHGRRKELAGKIQERYGKAETEVEKEVDEWLRMH